MARFGENKCGIHIVMDFETKKKIDCLKKLFYLSGERVSFGQIGEDAIRIVYALSFLSRDQFFMENFFKFLRLNSFFEKDSRFPDLLKFVNTNAEIANRSLVVPLNSSKLR